jgi:hypothetical protein
MEEGPSLTCNGTGGGEPDSVQNRNGQERCKNSRSKESCTDADERNESD